ncbi:MAG: VWA domain-containing protein [Anaeromyxobacter sp.]|nr:VWA domain-containing protein [Anaeromyxobacter sp.]MBL0276959.1 VWA domain-containing protein [Anaeromyxobacter sp.]
MSVGFLNPLLLWGLLAAALPLVVHLFFRRRPRPTPFPALDFVLRARKENAQRLRLKKLLLFTARTLLLAAAALALARPRAEQPASAAATPGGGPLATVLVLDASGSMSYRLGGDTLFSRARQQALDALTSLPGEAPVSALVCDGRPPAAPAPAFDRVAVRRTLDEAAPAFGHADLTSCVAAAARALAEAKGQEQLGKQIVVVTDLTAAAWRLDVPPPEVPGPKGPVRPHVEIVDAARGADLPNAAVTALGAEPDPAVGPRGYKLTAAVSVTGAEPAKDLALSLRVGGEARPAIRAFVDVPANATARKTLSHAFPAGGPATLSAAVPGDALALDDERVLTVTVPREIRALVVDGAPSPVKYRDEAYFVESALGSPASPVRSTLVDGEALREADLSRFDVVFLLNVRGVAGRTADLVRFVEGGGGLFLSMGDQVDPDLYARELGPLLPLPLHVVKTAAERGQAEAQAARLARVDEAHPALAVFTGDAREGLQGARFYRYMLTRPAPKGEAPVVLAAFDDGAPALVEARRGRGRVLLFTSTADRDWNDWPIRTSFLPALQRFAAWLSGGLEERRDVPTVVGTPRALRLGEGRELRALVGPDGKERSRRELEAAGLAPSEGGAALTFTPRLPGLWQVKVAERGVERLEPALAFAVVPDPRESDTRRLLPAELTAWFGGEAHARVDGHAAGGGATEGVPLWSWLLAAAVLFLLAEGFFLG